MNFSLLKFIRYFLFVLMVAVSLNGSATAIKDNTQKGIVFLLTYETNKSIDIDKAVLYISTNQLLKHKKDSVVISYDSHASPDSIVYNGEWTLPVFLKLKLITRDQSMESQIFSSSKESEIYEVFISDSSIDVRSKLVSSNYERNSSLKALILVLQAIFEMFIAFLIVRAFGISSLLILMVLVANVAAYPLYLFSMPVLNREFFIFLIKVIVMSLIGIKKIKVYQILIIVAILTVISLGIKEFLFFITSLL